MSPAVMAAVAIDVILVTGAIGATVVIVAGHRRQAALERRVRRAVAILPRDEVTEEDTPDEEEIAILRSLDDRARLWAAIEARYPMVHAPSALLKALGLGLVGGVAVVAAVWFLRFPFGWWTPAVLGAAGCASAWISLAWIQRRAETEFVAKFPDTVDQIVRLSATGVPSAEAIASVTEHAPHPVKPILAMFSDYLAAGLDPEDAAREVSKRYRVAELTMFLAVIRLQRRSGAGLTGAFANLSRALRERRQAGLKAKASTAQTRFTLLILTVMPFVLMGVQSFMSPAAMDMLFNTDTGAQLLRWGFALIAGGIFIARTVAANAVR